jgi:hypothetical protein
LTEVFQSKMIVTIWKEGRECKGGSLIVLLEAEFVSTLAEASTADVEAVLADHAAPLLADAAPALEGALRVLSRVLRNKVDRHWKGQP